MASEDIPLSARTAAALAQLQPVAEQVTQAAEALSKPVSAIEAALKRMHIAFEAWVTYKDRSTDFHILHWDIGYSRVNGRWGICLQIQRGPAAELTTETWHFNESPLYLRHPAIERLPDLLEALAKTGTTVARKLTSAVGNATAIADAVAPPAKAKK